MSGVCNECHSTIQPNYRGACVTCLRRELSTALHAVENLSGDLIVLRTDNATLSADLADAGRLLKERTIDRDDCRQRYESLTASVVSACFGTGALNAHELRERLDEAARERDEARTDNSVLRAEVDGWREVNVAAGAFAFVAAKHGRGAFVEQMDKSARAAKDAALGLMRATDASGALTRAGGGA